VLQILRIFEESVFDMVRGHGKVPIGWQDLVDSDVFPDDKHHSTIDSTNSNEDEASIEVEAADADGSSSHNKNSSFTPSIVQSWKCWAGLAAKAVGIAARQNHDAITSACWYLDFDSDFDAFLEAQPVQAAQRAVGNVVPREGRKQGGRVLGGEVAVWTERIDFTNFECRVWPRAAVIAMSMWGVGNINIIKPSGSARPPTRENEDRDRGVAILSSYVVFSHYLKRFGIHPADISIHTKSQSTQSRGYRPTLIRGTLSEQLSLLHRHDVVLTKERKYSSLEMKINSQCPSISDDIIRPMNLVTKINQCGISCIGEGSGCVDARSCGSGGNSDHRREVTAVFVNIAEGAGGSRRDLLNRWLRSQAVKGVAFIGLCELNMWHELSSTDEAHSNFPVMRARAAEAGFPFSHILHSEAHPYSVGVMAAVPFQIVGEYGPPLFQRGVLHVYFDTLDVHVFVAHLHAHDSYKREEETAQIASLVAPYLKNSGRKVIIMGDLNSLYLNDKPFHEEDNLLEIFQRTNHSVYTRLNKKFLNKAGTAINYQPLQILDTAELKDVCTEYCHRRYGYKRATVNNIEGGKHDESHQQEERRRCLVARCAHSQPTSYNPEVRIHPFTAFKFQ
jgi:endonuclease/exonuclease/phosphatase family metal-dependent hydrolase